MRSALIPAVLVALAIVPSVHAQSLTDVARAEEARRKAVKAHAKVYTNDDLLRPDGSPAPPAAAPAAAAATPADAPKTDGAKADGKSAQATQTGEPKKDEKYWKDRITAPRNAAAQDKVLLDALQSRVNALSTDFVNTDDPAQRGLVESNRKTALNEMDRLTKDLAKQTKAEADIQEEARKANVPPGWLR